MKTELEELRVCLQLAGGLGVTEAQAAFDRVMERYESLQSPTPPEWRNTNWHLTVPSDIPFSGAMAHIFAESLRAFPWPPGIVVRLFPAGQGRMQFHEFLVHHESVEVGVGMEVIESKWVCIGDGVFIESAEVREAERRVRHDRKTGWPKQHYVAATLCLTLRDVPK